MRWWATTTFGATAFVVVATLAGTMDPARFAGVALLCLTCSALSEVLCHGLSDAARAGSVTVEVCRLAARWLAVAMVPVTLLAAVVTVVLWLDLLAAAVVLGAGFSASGNLARMVRFSDGRTTEVLVGDAAWLVGTLVLAFAAWAGGLTPAVGAVGGWIIGGAGWTALALGDGPAPEPGIGGLGGWRRLLAGMTLPASPAMRSLIGYLAGMAAVLAAGRPVAASMLEVGRLVGLPAGAVYSGLRFGLPGAPIDGHSQPGPHRANPLAAVGIAGAATGLLTVAVIVVLAAPVGAGTALDEARRWWPLIAASQLARLVVEVVGDTARPLLGSGTSIRIGAASAALGAVVPLALVLAVGDIGGLVSQLVLAGLVYALIQHSLRLSSLAHRRSPHIRSIR